MLVNTEKVRVLRGVDLFLALWGEELAQIATITDEVEFRSGDLIIREGDLGEELFVIVAGQVRVFREDLDLAVLGRGQVFGEVSILDSEPRTASVAAQGDVTLLRIRQKDFEDIMSRMPQIALGIVKVLCGRLRNENAVQK